MRQQMKGEKGKSRAISMFGSLQDMAELLFTLLVIAILSGIFFGTTIGVARRIANFIEPQEQEFGHY
jgi:hypothetical protein